jgi:hypothetical protein
MPYPSARLKDRMGLSFRWRDIVRASFIAVFSPQEPTSLRFVDALTQQDAAAGRDEETMMKSMFLTIALAMSTAAVAQAQPPAEAPAEPMTAQPDASMPVSTDTSAAPMQQGKIVNPSPSVEQAFPPPPPKADYPWCSRAVTDGCKQRRDPGYGK